MENLQGKTNIHLRRAMRALALKKNLGKRNARRDNKTMPTAYMGEGGEGRSQSVKKKFWGVSDSKGRRKEQKIK